MSRPLDERMGDILAAVERCVKYKHFLNSADADVRDMAYDAILRNLAAIGEAVKSLPREVTDASAEIPWHGIAGLRNIVVHEYFRVDPTMIAKIVEQDLGPLAERMREVLHKTDVSDPDR